MKNIILKKIKSECLFFSLLFYIIMVQQQDDCYMYEPQMREMSWKRWEVGTRLFNWCGKTLKILRLNELQRKRSIKNIRFLLKTFNFIWKTLHFMRKHSKQKHLKNNLWPKTWTIWPINVFFKILMFSWKLKCFLNKLIVFSSNYHQF